MENFEPQATFLVKELNTLRILTDPLRTQIYEILIPEAANVKQIAERLGLASSRLYYHINMMEKAGLLRVVETRMVSNMVEKFYRAVAYDLDIAPDLLNFATQEGQESVANILVSGIDTTRDDLLRSIRARLFEVDQNAAQPTRKLMVSRTTMRLSDADAEQLQARMQALVQEYQAKDQPGAQNYALLVTFYPSFYYPSEG